MEISINGKINTKSLLKSMVVKKSVIDMIINTLPITALITMVNITALFGCVKSFTTSNWSTLLTILHV